MTWTIALLLAVLQGLTEFFPVSSSGHLALFQNLVEQITGSELAEALAFDIIVHVGTMLAVVFYFRKDLGHLLQAVIPGGRGLSNDAAAKATRREIFFLGVSLVPTAVIGLALRSAAASILHRPVIVSALIGVTGLVLLFTRSTGSTKNSPPSPNEFTLTRALAMGVAQGMAVLPGLSRSGLTIAAGLAAGLSPMAAFRLSFLMSIPTITGAALLELGGHPEAMAQLGWPAVGAAVVAGLVALVALAILSRTLRQGQFHYFSWYCFAVAGLGIMYFTLGGGR
jgi:undecaprenyl-diphosphatase